jgi:hypothetical protein
MANKPASYHPKSTKSSTESRAYGARSPNAPEVVAHGAPHRSEGTLPQNAYAALSLRDLLDARDQHVRLQML